jgi:hypothetical protein
LGLGDTSLCLSLESAASNGAGFCVALDVCLAVLEVFVRKLDLLTDVLSGLVSSVVLVSTNFFYSSASSMLTMKTLGLDVLGLNTVRFSATGGATVKSLCFL